MASAHLTSLLTKISIGSTAFAALTWMLNESWCVVPPGTRALVWDRKDGIEKSPILGEGFHLLIPLWEKAIFMDVRTTPKQIDTGTGSKDLQNVSLSLRVLYRPKEDKLVEIATRIGLDYAERILPSVGNEVLKAVVAQYDAGELITQREAVSQQIRESLTERSKAFHIHLDDVSITHLGFSSEYTSAIEAKQVAQQDAERARFVVLKAEQEMRAAIIRAEGESAAAKLITDATAQYGSGLIELRRLEAAKEISETLSKSRKITFLPSSSNVFLNGFPQQGGR